MSARLKKLTSTLVITAILLSFTLTNIKIAFSNDTGGKIDLFTQKEPYSGKGPNVPSDAFSPDELVILYALATYNEVPIPNLLTAFYVTTPNNTSFSFTAKTNSSGIATVSFAIPPPLQSVNESQVFGEWLAIATAMIDGQVLQDTLTFRVDWIVKLISVRTIDENLTYRANFGVGGDVGLEVTLRSVAMVMKTATLAIVVQDELQVPVNFSHINNFEVQPNEKLLFIYFKLRIPSWAHIGNATVFVSAFTAPASEGGVPYCPEISTRFSITPYEPLSLAFHDVAVINVVPSATSVEIGQPLSIGATVRNEGTEVESFNVSAYFDGQPKGTLAVTGLSPYAVAILNFPIDTSNFRAGNYTVTVSIPPLVNEADLTDNVFVDGVIEVKPKVPTVIHNIAIVNVKISNTTLYIGELAQINVTVANKGTATETFNVGTYYDSTLIATLQVSALAPNTQATLIFIWDTSLVPEGFYQISAYAPLPNDIDVSDNTYIDGVVQVKTKPPPLMFHDVAVLNVTPSSTSVYIGETLDIDVEVKNQGNYTESFNVTVYYDSSTIGTLPVDRLEAGAKKTLVFHWNTGNVPEGNYTLRAEASLVPGDINPENNSFVDGVVKVVAARPLFTWLLPFLILLLILLIILFIVWLYRRKERRNKAQKTSVKVGCLAWQ